MKIVLLIIITLLTGCSTNITTQSFVYQDKQLEQSLNIDQIKTELADAKVSASVSQISLTTEDGITLRGIKLIREDARVNIVFFSGNGMKISKSSKILNHFALIPANVVWFDYRGVGVSDKKEKLLLDDLRMDSLSIFDYAKNELPDSLPIAIHGLSMGSLIATYVANNKKTDGLILDGAISTVPELVDNLIPIWMSPFYTVNVSSELSEISNIDLIKNYHNPLLLLIGEDDQTTPVEYSKALYQASPSVTKVITIVPNVDHGVAMKKEQSIKAYQDFISQLPCCKSS